MSARIARSVKLTFAGTLAVVTVPAFGQAPAARPPADVVIARGLSPAVVLAVSVAAASTNAAFLLDTPRAETTIRPFLDRLRPGRVVPVGDFPDALDLTRTWGLADRGILAKRLDPRAYVWSRFPRADKVVIAPAAPAGQLLHAACLAGALRVPLIVLSDDNLLPPDFRERVKERGVREILAVGTAGNGFVAESGITLTKLADAAAVAAAHLKELGRPGSLDTLVLANPSDLKGMAALAPYIAVKHRAALLLTDPDGKNAGGVVAAALAHGATAKAESLIVAANLTAIPVAKRPNPAEGRDEWIDVEPWSPAGNGLYSLSAGRLFHADRAVVTLVLAREALIGLATGPPKALIASNPGGGLPLLETFSRNTARELANAGYEVTARFEDDVEPAELRKLLPKHDVFLWEGHYRTLIDRFELPKWTEPLPPSLMFLQSCLALNAEDAGLLFDRGAVAVVGSPNRTYSGSGGAFSLAYLDALAYDGRSLGLSLRHAKNFLLCYAELKSKRLGESVKLEGANLRAAWAFTLWGDPTVQLRRPTAKPDALPPLRVDTAKTSITLQLPERRYPNTNRAPYKAEMWPGGRLAGLITPEADDVRRLAPMAFAEVRLTGGRDGEVPRLSSKLPEKNWVFQWDARLGTGYLLAMPRAKDTDTITFRVKWGTH